MLTPLQKEPWGGVGRGLLGSAALRGNRCPSARAGPVRNGWQVMMVRSVWWWTWTNAWLRDPFSAEESLARRTRMWISGRSRRLLGANGVNKNHYAINTCLIHVFRSSQRSAGRRERSPKDASQASCWQNSTTQCGVVLPLSTIYYALFLAPMSNARSGSILRKAVR